MRLLKGRRINFMLCFTAWKWFEVKKRISNLYKIVFGKLSIIANEILSFLLVVNIYLCYNVEVNI
jgi:hypothetical protein